MSHSGLLFVLPGSSSPRPISRLAVKGTDGCGVSEGRLPLTSALDPSLSVIPLHRCVTLVPQRQPVKSLLASRETLLGDGFGILSFRSFFSFLFLFGLLLLAPLLLSNSSPHPKSPTIFVGIIFVSDPSTPASYLRCLFPHPLRTVWQLLYQ